MWHLYGSPGVGGARCRARQSAILRCAMTAKGYTQKSRRVKGKSALPSRRSAGQAVSGEFIRPTLSREWGAPRCEKKRSSAPMWRSALPPINGHRRRGMSKKCPRGRHPASSSSSLIRVYGWALAVDPPLSFDRSPALTGSARRRFPPPALWPRPLLHLVSTKTA